MNAVLLGDREDARGFALAGGAAGAGDDARGREAELRPPGALPELALVLVSPAVAALAPRALEAFRGRAGAPVVLVLP
jgi:hypothetical protein